MKNYDDPEAVQARKDQPDPIVMYLIVKESLGMGVGKTSAQCAHASQILQCQFNILEKELEELEAVEKTFGSLNKREAEEWAVKQPAYHIFSEWLETSFRKVVLRANDNQFAKVKEEKINNVVVVDAGLTEIAAGSETVIGLWPMRKSQAPKIVKKLQVLK